MGPVDRPRRSQRCARPSARGFETVTYILPAREHKDSQGHAGSLSAGDVQWMTAGAGVIHAEMPSAKFQQTGGRLHGFQLWVNLPRQNKMMQPRYQEIPSARIPTASSEDQLVTVRIIAGEALGERAVIETVTPIMYLHFTIRPGGTVWQQVPERYNAFAYIVNGEGLFGTGNERVTDGQMVLFAQDGDQVRIENPVDARATLELLLIGGVPLNEPVSRYGPFVMNTESEIRQAIEDYRLGRMGAIKS